MKAASGKVQAKSSKAAAPSNTPSSISPTDIRILKIATCPSLSTRSTLTYHLGCSDNADESVEIHFRIKANTARGFFSTEWISTRQIQAVFDKIPAGRTVSSVDFNGIFRGKSVNTSGFLLAVLKAEGLMAAAAGQTRSYHRTQSYEFTQQINQLVASSISLNENDKPAMPGKVSKKVSRSAKDTSTAS